MTPLRTAARTMLAAVFVTQGWAAFRHPERLAGRAKPVTDRMAPTLNAIHPSLPTEAETLVRANGAVQFTGGLLLATGRATTPAALMLAASLVPTTLAGHAYWQFEDPAERAQQRIQFLKNASMFGGLILAALDNEGRPGVAWRAGDLANRAQRKTRHATGHVTRGARRAVRTAKREARLARLRFPS
jgi:putative oxidoreductase